MHKKIFLWLFLFLTLTGFAVSVVVTTFTDGSSSENLTFVGGDSELKYINVTSQYIMNATIVLKGYNLNPTPGGMTTFNDSTSSGNITSDVVRYIDLPGNATFTTATVDLKGYNFTTYPINLTIDTGNDGVEDLSCSIINGSGCYNMINYFNDSSYSGNITASSVKYVKLYYDANISSTAMIDLKGYPAFNIINFTTSGSQVSCLNQEEFVNWTNQNQRFNKSWLTTNSEGGFDTYFTYSFTNVTWTLDGCTASNCGTSCYQYVYGYIYAKNKSSGEYDLFQSHFETSNRNPYCFVFNISFNTTNEDYDWDGDAYLRFYYYLSDCCRLASSGAEKMHYINGSRQNLQEVYPSLTIDTGNDGIDDITCDSINETACYDDRTEFSDGTSYDNITFSTDGGSTTKYISLPYNANITSATIDLKGYIGYHYKYQEDANLSYTPDATDWTDNGGNVIDGDWYTLDTAVPQAPCDYAYYYFNYTKINHTDGIRWQMKDDYSLKNKTVKSSCWNKYSDILSLRVASLRGAGCTARISWRCFDGTWDSVWSSISGYQAYEDGVWWGTYPANVTIDTGNDGTLDYTNYSVNFNGSVSINLNTTAIQNWLSSNCASGYCNVPINFTSDIAGFLEYSNINIDYKITDNFDLNLTAIQNWLSSNCASGYCNVPINFSTDTGKIEYSGIDINYNLSIDDMELGLSSVQDWMDTNCFTTTCTMPINFTSDVFGKLQYSDITISYASGYSSNFTVDTGNDGWFSDVLCFTINETHCLSTLNSSLDNTSFVRSESKTEYINIPYNANVTSAVINLEGYAFGGTYTGDSFPYTDSFPRGITQNGTYLWIVDEIAREVYKYWINGTYTGDSFDLFALGNGGMGYPSGITQNGTFFWIVDNELVDHKNKVNKYQMDGTWTGESFYTLRNPGNIYSKGITIYNNTFYVTDYEDDLIYKYDIDGTYLGNFSLTSGHNNVAGITNDGIDLWVMDWSDHKIYLYDIATESYVDYIDVSTPVGIQPVGITQDQNNFWTISSLTDTLYKYAKQYPTNLTIDTANDGFIDYQNNTLWDGSYVSIINVDLNITAIGSWLANCKFGYCSVPLNITSETGGKLEYSLDIDYYLNNSFDLKIPSNNWVSENCGTGYCEMPVDFYSATRGRIQYSNLYVLINEVPKIFSESKSPAGNVTTTTIAVFKVNVSDDNVGTVSLSIKKWGQDFSSYAWTNYTVTNYTGNSTHREYNYSFDCSSLYSTQGVPGQLYGWYFVVNDTYNATNNTDSYFFEVFPVCGNGICEGGETTTNCPADCHPSGSGGGESTPTPEPIEPIEPPPIPLCAQGCPNYCYNKTLYFSGVCVDGECQYAQLKCQTACQAGRCVTCIKWCPDKCINNWLYYQGYCKDDKCVYQTKECGWYCEEEKRRGDWYKRGRCICKELGMLTETPEECCSGITVKGICVENVTVSFKVMPTFFKLFMEPKSTKKESLTIVNLEKYPIFIYFKVPENYKDFIIIPKGEFIIENSTIFDITFKAPREGFKEFGIGITGELDNITAYKEIPVRIEVTKEIPIPPEEEIPWTAIVIIGALIVLASSIYYLKKRKKPKKDRKI